MQTDNKPTGYSKAPMVNPERCDDATDLADEILNYMKQQGINVDICHRSDVQDPAG